MTDSTEQQLATIIRSIFDAFAAHESGVIEQHMDPDATVWDVFTPQLIRGPEEREKFHADDQAQMQARGPLTLNIDDPVIDVWGDMAIARYYLNFSYEPPNATDGEIRITDVFCRRDDLWVIVHHHEGMVPTGVPPIDES